MKRIYMSQINTSHYLCGQSSASSGLLGIDNKLDRADALLQLLQPIRNAHKSTRDDLDIVGLITSSASELKHNLTEKKVP